VAEARYGEAIALAETLGLRPLLAHCRHGLGILCRSGGRLPEAREHLSAAATMFGEMDMRYWMAQSETAITELA